MTFSQQSKIIIKGYGLVTSNLIMFLVEEKKVDPLNITVFEEKTEIGGCWLEANSYSVTILPIIGNREAYYLASERIVNHLKGSPLNKEAILHNLRTIWDMLRFNLVLGTKITSVDEKEKKVTVTDQNGKQSIHPYDFFISPRYRTMNSYKRSTTLYDGMLSVDLSKYNCFSFVGNSLNTAETVKYIVENINPQQDFKIKIYFRNFHPFFPQSYLYIQKAGLPSFYLLKAQSFVVNKFNALISDNANLLNYIHRAEDEAIKKGYAGIVSMSGDFLFHPAVAKRIEMIQYSGDIKDIKPQENELLIDSRNELASSDSPTFPNDHFKIDMGHLMHPVLWTYNSLHDAYIHKGIGTCIWNKMNGIKPDDKYYRLAEKSLCEGKKGTCFWNYSHDIQAKMIPFAYFFFPIDTKFKYRLWLVIFNFLRWTGLIAFFINIKALEEDSSLIEECEAAFFQQKKEWEELDLRFGGGVPYPISYNEFLEQMNKIKCSMFDLKKHLGFYRRVRYIYGVAILGLCAVAVYQILSAII